MEKDQAYSGAALLLLFLLEVRASGRQLHARAGKLEFPCLAEFLTLHLSRLQSELRISSYVITVVHFNHLGLNVTVFAKSGSSFLLLFPLTSLASEISAVCECV